MSSRNGSGRRDLRSLTRVDGRRVLPNPPPPPVRSIASSCVELYGGHRRGPLGSWVRCGGPM